MVEEVCIIERENERNDGVVRWEDRTHLRRSIIQPFKVKAIINNVEQPKTVNVFY